LRGCGMVCEFCRRRAQPVVPEEDKSLDRLSAAAPRSNVGELRQRHVGTRPQTDAQHDPRESERRDSPVPPVAAPQVSAASFPAPVAEPLTAPVTPPPPPTNPLRKAANALGSVDWLQMRDRAVRMAQSPAGGAVWAIANAKLGANFSQWWGTTRKDPSALGFPYANLDHDDFVEAHWRIQATVHGYSMDESALKVMLKRLNCKLVRFQRQALHGDSKPQWYVCCRESGELVVVFRGTMSLADCFTDALALPTQVGDVKIHTGFHNAVMMAWEDGLNQELTREKVAAASSVLFCGHSLGGAMCMAILGMGLLPDAPPGKYRACAFGAPRAYYGSSPRPSSLHDAEIHQWILENDAVPQVLGSDSSALRGAVAPLLGALRAASDRAGNDAFGWVTAIGELSDQVLEKCQDYVQIRNGRLFWMCTGHVVEVPVDKWGSTFRYGSVWEFDPQGALQHPYFAYQGALGHLVNVRHGDPASPFAPGVAVAPLQSEVVPAERLGLISRGDSFYDNQVLDD